MTRDDVTISTAPPSSSGSDWVAIFLELTEEAQLLYLYILRVGVAGLGWGTLVEMLVGLQEDDRTRDLVTRLGSIPHAPA